MVTKIKLICEVCGKEFERRKTEVKRNEKFGRRICCSRNCTGKITITENIPIDKRCNTAQLVASNRLDKFSPFRLLYRTAKRRAEDSKKEFSVSLQYLKEIWDKQNGICPYTGWVLENPPTSGGKRIKAPNRASADRIDSSKGYLRGNVEFVCCAINYAKNSFTKEEMKKFLFEIGGPAGE